VASLDGSGTQTFDSNGTASQISAVVATAASPSSSPIPEPYSIVLLATGALGVAAKTRRRIAARH